MFYLDLNCWFCNKNSKVSIFKRNSWICDYCDQYNGFTKDGDYNKLLPEMYADPKLNNNGSPNVAHHNHLNNHHHTNSILCYRCNYYQKLKVEKLADFKPVNEETYDFEIEIYKQELEKLFELCDTCKPKVKFEITKQDGVLKQYLFKLGKLNYLFDNYKNNGRSSRMNDENDNDDEDDNNQDREVDFQNDGQYLLHIFCKLIAVAGPIIYSLLIYAFLFVFTFNQYDFMQFQDEKLAELNDTGLNWSVYFINQLRNFSYQRSPIMEIASPVNSQNLFTRRMNLLLPKVLFIIVALVLVLIMRSILNSRCKLRTLALHLFISISSVLYFIYFNSDAFNFYFNPTSSLKYLHNLKINKFSSIIDLLFCLSIIVYLTLKLIVELVQLLMNFVFFVLKTTTTTTTRSTRSSSSLRSINRCENKSTGAAINFKLSSLSNNKSSKSNNHTAAKSCINGGQQSSGMATAASTRLAKSVSPPLLRSSRFDPSNQTNRRMECDESSSIVSGLTNLYLNRSGSAAAVVPTDINNNNQQHNHNNHNKSNDLSRILLSADANNDSKSSNSTPTPDSTNAGYSFYQTTLSPRLSSHHQHTFMTNSASFSNLNALKNAVQQNEQKRSVEKKEKSSKSVWFSLTLLSLLTNVLLVAILLYSILLKGFFSLI